MTTARTRGRPGRSRVLTERQVLDVALRLVDEGGSTALSVRGVAGELDVAPNSIYTYFSTREALRAGLVEHVLGELDLDRLPTDGDWREGLRHLATALYQVLTRHPGVVPLFVAGPMFGPRSLAAGERVLDLLAEAGFTAPDAARALYTLLVYTIGFAAMDAAELPSGSHPTIEDRVAARREDFVSVPAGEYPRTRAAADTMAEFITARQFHAGLEALIRGLAPSPAGDGRRPATDGDLD